MMNDFYNKLVKRIKDNCLGLSGTVPKGYE